MTDSRPVLVHISLAHWDATWRGAQHLTSRLAATPERWRVLYVEPSVSVLSPLHDRGRVRQLARRVRTVREDLAVVTPLAVPPQAHPRTRTVNARSMERAVRSALEGLGWGDPDVLMVNHPFGWRLGEAYPAARLVAHLTDEPFFQTTDYLGEYYKAIDVASAAVCVSQPLVERCESLGRPALLVPQGVDASAIAGAAGRPEPEDLRGVPRPRIVYVGTLSHRVDHEAFLNVTRARPDWQFVCIGGAATTELAGTREVVGPVAQLARVPNVHILGAKAQRDLGAYLAQCDAGWVPYMWDPFNRTSNPLKVMEYLAAGLPSVVNAFASMEPLSDLVSLVPEGGDYVEPLERALQGEAGSGDAGPEERVAFARANTWQHRADALSGWLAKQV